MAAEKKSALIIASSHYEDALLRQLVAPPQDAEALAQVLGDPAVCGFQVRSLIDEPSYRVCEEIDAFYGERERDELTLLYFSGHGITDDDGLLYYAARNTQRKRLRSTAVAAAWVNELMTRCRSRRQVLLLDCCHSGAFARTKSAGTVNIGQQLAATAREEGRGRFVITASDAFQYSFEGDSVEGQGVYSVFTKALVEGLRSGEADLDNDGLITLDELYRFVHRRVREQTPQQSPRKWESDAEGVVVIGLNPRPAEAALPDDIVNIMQNLIPEARERAIPRLAALLQGKHRGLALAAHRALLTLIEDDSRRVSSAAQKCLDEFGIGAEEAASAQATVAPELRIAVALPSPAPREVPIPVETPAADISPAAVAPQPEPKVKAETPREEPERFQNAADPVTPKVEHPTPEPSAALPIPGGVHGVAEDVAVYSTVEAIPAQPEQPAVAIDAGLREPSVAEPVETSTSGVAANPSPPSQLGPTLADRRDVQAPAGSFAARIRRRWISVPRALQIPIVAIAIGLVWTSLFLIALNWSRGASATSQFFAALTTGALLGLALTLAMRLFGAELDWTRQTLIMLVWTLSGLTLAMVHWQFWLSLWSPFHVDFHVLWPLCIFTFTLPSAVSGALTGMFFADSVGESRVRGLVAGGLGFLVGGALSPWSGFFLYIGSGDWFSSCPDFFQDSKLFQYSSMSLQDACASSLADVRSDWFDQHWVGASAMAFLGGAIAVAGMLWLLRRKDRSARDRGKASDPVPIGPQ